jgi:hypothetical protein
MDEITSVSGNRCEVVILKLPLLSVNVPSPVPLIITEAEETVSLLALLFTFPVMVTPVCENETREDKIQSSEYAK